MRTLKSDKLPLETVLDSLSIVFNEMRRYLRKMWSLNQDWAKEQHKLKKIL